MAGGRAVIGQEEGRFAGRQQSLGFTNSPGFDTAAQGGLSFDFGKSFKTAAKPQLSPSDDVLAHPLSPIFTGRF